MQQLSASGLQAWLNDETRPRPVLLDVRETWEFETCRIDGSMLVPMGQIPHYFHELNAQAEVVVICHHGVRSYQVGIFLEHNGFAKVFNLQGGVEDWARQVDPAMPRY